MNNSLKKIIELAKKTGDKVIVTDSDGSNPYVVMNLDDYEKLLSEDKSEPELTDTDLLNKINQDVSDWKTRQQDMVKEENVQEPEFSVEPETTEVSKDIDEDERFYFEPVE